MAIIASMNNVAQKSHDVIVIGAGAAGIIASIVAARNGHKVLLIEKLSQIASKLKATGGGRCNLTNTLSNDDFMAKFGRNGRFMSDALALFDHQKLIEFFRELGVETHAPDGYRVFPISHSSKSVIDALKSELEKLGVAVVTSAKVDNIELENDMVYGVKCQDTIYNAGKIIISTGGLGYPVLGAEGDGYEMAKALGHTVASTHPAMMPLQTSETWVANCTADTIAKVEMKINLKKYNNIKYKGDLIFTRSGIRGPVVLDMAREITPLLDKYGAVPILANLTKRLNEEQIRTHISNNPTMSISECISMIVPLSVANELIIISGIEVSAKCSKIAGQLRDNLIKSLAWTPLTVTGHDGFRLAMITRGGVSLKEIDPRTMQSKVTKGVYFCGEVMDLDGPCGGYNLQWSFASGYLAGMLLAT